MNRTSKLVRLGALGLAASLALTACGGDDTDDNAGSSDNASSGPEGTQWYFVDGNTADYSADFDAGTLAGTKATYPGPELADDFKDRLLGVNGKLKDFTYGPESYDATIAAALAALAAGDDSGTAVGSQMQAVTSEGEKCTDFATCADLLADGEDIDYDGVSGPIDLNSTGSPSAATIGVFEYADDNTYAPVDYVTGEIPDVDSVGAKQKIGKVEKGDGTLNIGGLLPTSGDLAFLGPPEIAGVELAIQEIDEAGTDLKVNFLGNADSGDGTPNIAPSSVDSLLAKNVDVIVGAASSSVSLSVIDRITGAGVAQISPANTSTAFDSYADSGLYFRTAPSDVLQGSVMASTLLGDGHQNVAILARQDSYGEALADNVEKFFTEAGGTIVSKTLYSPEAATYTAEIDELASTDPDAIVLIAFDETKKIVPELVKAGLVLE
ncbi:ABC transporter substrate-binding protein [Nocardioides sambongensis]|uniref:ABC transporter substrate-binding protein n=1 Tax=Nocardioides sambongensis TaxID=2589074 RepID=UPI001E52D462|nr:ABC transporter substrate-binding protein [Nocardioides sambongensis]